MYSCIYLVSYLYFTVFQKQFEVSYQVYVQENLTDRRKSKVHTQKYIPELPKMGQKFTFKLPTNQSKGGNTTRWKIQSICVNELPYGEKKTLDFQGSLIVGRVLN